MNKYDIVRKIEEFAPLETQEKWDCSGWGVNINGKWEIENEKLIDESSVQFPSPREREVFQVDGDRNLEKRERVDNNEDIASVQQSLLNMAKNNNIHKVLFALTVTDKIIKQAREKGCDMIISHHPLFFVPLEWKDINIYSAHTNLDKANGGTTDRLIKELGFSVSESYEFVRIVNLEKEISVEELRQKLLKISPDLRYINNYDTKNIKKIGFCAGSGSEFINEYNVDAFVTGDLKFHTALDSKCVVFDIGHFESEIFAPKILKEITDVGDKGVIADEKSPFI